MPPTPADLLAELKLQTFDDALGRRVIETHIWAVREGLRGAAAYDLFDGYCQRLVVDGVMLWRATWRWRRSIRNGAATATPGGATSTRSSPSNMRMTPMSDLGQQPALRPHSPSAAGEDNPQMRRRLTEGPEQRDFAVLEEFFAGGATDYFANLFVFGKDGDRSHGSGTVYSFATDRRAGSARTTRRCCR